MRNLQGFAGKIMWYRIVNCGRYGDSSFNELYLDTTVSNNCDSGLDERFIVKPIGRSKDLLEEVVSESDLVVCSKTNVDNFAISFYKRDSSIKRLSSLISTIREHIDGIPMKEISGDVIEYSRGRRTIENYNRIDTVIRGNLPR